MIGLSLFAHQARSAGFQPAFSFSPPQSLRHRSSAESCAFVGTVRRPRNSGSPLWPLRFVPPQTSRASRNAFGLLRFTFHVLHLFGFACETERTCSSFNPVARVAQLDRVTASGAVGCGFDPRRAYHLPNPASSGLASTSKPPGQRPRITAVGSSVGERGLWAGRKRVRRRRRCCIPGNAHSRPHWLSGPA
jgi:hypothetical protein